MRGQPAPPPGTGPHGWDRAMIAQGMFHLAHSASGEEISEYHLQAGIAACHCAAPDYAATDWQQILSLYDRLVEFDDSGGGAEPRRGARGDSRATGRHRSRGGDSDLQSLDSYYCSTRCKANSSCGSITPAPPPATSARRCNWLKSGRAALPRPRLKDCETHPRGRPDEDQIQTVCAAIAASKPLRLLSGVGRIVREDREGVRGAGECG